MAITATSSMMKTSGKAQPELPMKIMLALPMKNASGATKSIKNRP